MSFPRFQNTSTTSCSWKDNPAVSSLVLKLDCGNWPVNVAVLSMRQKRSPAQFSGSWVGLRMKQLIGKRTFFLSSTLSSHKGLAVGMVLWGLSGPQHCSAFIRIVAFIQSLAEGYLLVLRTTVTQRVGSQIPVSRGGAHTVFKQPVWSMCTCE